LGTITNKHLLYDKQKEYEYDPSIDKPIHIFIRDFYKIENINKLSLESEHDANILLIDIRDEYLFHDHHIKGSISCPIKNTLEEETQLLYQKIKEKNYKKIYIICQYGKISNQYAQKLHTLYENVYSIAG